MSKPSLPESALVKSIRQATLSPALAYDPSDEQRSVKAKFWLAFRQNPLSDAEDITPALIEQLTGTDVQRWTSDKNFWAWFNCRDQVRQNLEVAAERASELAMHYLDPSVLMNDNARVQLIKYVLEFSGRTPPTRREVKWADKEIADLDEKELDALISRLSNKKQLPPSSTE